MFGMEPVARVDYRARAQRAASLLHAQGDAVREIVSGKYLVPSQSTPGARYVVDVEAVTCTCPNFEERGGQGYRCKHLLVVQHLRHEVELPEETKVVSEEKKRPYYYRPWRVIHRARTDLGRLGPHMLAEAVDALGLPAEEHKVGRPPVPLRDIVFASLIKEFTRAPASSTIGYLERFQKEGLIGRVPSTPTLLREMAQPELQPIFQRLIVLTGMPLLGLDTTAATDSTGFGTGIFDCWNRHKHGGEAEQKKYERWLAEHQGRSHRWVRLHVTFGTTTKAIASFQVTESRGPGTGDSPMFPELVRRAVQAGYPFQNWTADKAYGQKKSHFAMLEQLGINPILAFKSDAPAHGNPAYERSYHFFQTDPDAWGKIYVNRVQAESSIFALKERWGRRLDCRLPMAQYNELSARCVCHNVYSLIRAVHEFGIDPAFYLPKSLRIGDLDNAPHNDTEEPQ
jgi:hypothetical protein